jgi:hypothetical protein
MQVARRVDVPADGCKCRSDRCVGTVSSGRLGKWQSLRLSPRAPDARARGSATRSKSSSRPSTRCASTCGADSPGYHSKSGWLHVRTAPAIPTSSGCSTGLALLPWSARGPRVRLGRSMPPASRSLGGDGDGRGRASDHRRRHRRGPGPARDAPAIVALNGAVFKSGKGAMAVATVGGRAEVGERRRGK